MTKLKNNFLFFIVVIAIFLSFGHANSKEYSKRISKQIEVLTKCDLKIQFISCFNFNIRNSLKVTLLEDPYRVQIDFEEQVTFNKSSFKNFLIEKIRISQTSNGGSRLVLELSKPAIITDIKLNKQNDGMFDLDVSINETTATKFVIANYLIKKNKGNILALYDDKIVKKQKKLTKSKNILLNKKSIRLSKNNLKKKYIVFIDPGHGGKDPGAIGNLGTLEKNITLEAGILISKILKKNKFIDVVLSRDKDIYLSLRQRIKLAKNNNSDILISIHADSSKNKKAQGLSVFSLSNKASDKEAEMLARRENSADSILGNSNDIKDPIIYGSLIKMIQREAMNESSSLARSILSNLEKTKLTVNRGHRFAGFTVLKSYDIPSILIEIGFLSNKQEEKKLLNKRYIYELSQNIANAIENYILMLE